jgi:hypothetical protein
MHTTGGISMAKLQLQLDEIEYIALHPRATNLTGKVVGRLVVLGPIDKSPCGRVRWLCRCECGNLSKVFGSSLRENKTLSCGCLSVDKNRAMQTTHGLTYHPLFKRWRNIIDRTTNPNNRSYKDYGGRGITMCDEWRHNFKAFHDYVIQLTHYGEEGYTLDRIDNSLGYAPGNVKYSDITEQNRNKRTVHTISYKGQTKTVGEWAQETGIKYCTLLWRLNNNWPIEKLLTKKAKYFRKP